MRSVFPTIERDWLFVLPTTAVLCRIGIKEQMLIDTFGDAYRDHRRRTRKLIPRVY